MTEKEWPHFTVEIRSPETVDVMWSRLWDLSRHSRAVPLTTVRSQGTSLRRGARFIARTELGLITIDDRMIVRRWEPPYHAVIEKVGPIFFGTIDAKMVREGEYCVLRWKLSYRIKAVPNLVTRVTQLLAQRAYRVTLKKILGTETQVSGEVVLLGQKSAVMRGLAGSDLRQGSGEAIGSGTPITCR
ncbi:MAG: hypothetical protein Q4P05_01970 [Actinomycetaceae bacterium]|nr:hypothetical protein [Actinomycetaceae bacterium]